MGASGWRAIHRAGEQRLDDVIAQRNQRRHCFQARRGRFITPRTTDTLDHVLCSQFFEIVGSMTWTVLGGRVAGRDTDFLGKSGSGETAGRGGERKNGLSSPTHALFVEVDAADFCFAYRRGLR